MTNKNDALLQRLLATFRVEADEHLEAMAAGLLALEKTPSGAQAASVIETIFREAHSLKGASRAVNIVPIESLCQSLEGVFAALKKGQLPVSVPLLDLLHRAIDGLANLLAGDAGAVSTIAPAVALLISQLEQAANGFLPAQHTITASAIKTTAAAPAMEAPAAAVAPHAPPVTFGPASGTVRISVTKLDTVMCQVEELISPRLAARQRALELRDVAATVSAWKKARMHIQPALRQIEHTTARSDSSTRWRKELLKVLDYLEGEHLFMVDIENRLSKLNKSAARDQRALAAMTDSLLHDVKEMQLLPFASLLDVLPRLARDLAREQGKEVELALQGGEIELDRRMLDELKDPLIHLLRNAIDHGIESPVVRTTLGKPVQGTITLAVSQRDGGKVELLVADDGAGIDGERVKAAAGKLGMLGEEEGGISERETLALVFQSGVSTSPIITDVSGRGLGLAIVREKVERLGGTVLIESKHGLGTSFHIVLPLSLATFRAVLVRVGEQLCAIPSTGVERVARIATEAIRTVENRETIVLDKSVVALAGLADVLEIALTASAHADAHVPVIVLGLGDARVAFRVDEILGEQEILVKSLGPQLARVRNVAGASMLGTGRVVPVLNVADLLKSAVSHVAAPHVPTADKPTNGKKLSILVAEDSITSRSLLKNILESAGYVVSTAVDGMDALTTLKTAAFDLIVSDVEMPRMDGFDLTARIRADKQLAALPVVLVTALESREHRERGIDAGANAYIVKSSFDQSNLLDIIRRLI
ncbi:MAG: hybrid sensor histidine kinase/response regulator [Rhodoferax sp.]|uniref:hybrid sensor histidine kinase/response regulator n=1 Tax=Rhodoferax sp. TaxID=50421 RepID=UPI0027325C10|nr:hybrid sensor histidine kinase/response regulator [Rhodoferax sp.]MDP2677997.1 hybrid sensor histidine kinase/response regulator [Rhodoferax sp.]